MIKIKQFLPPVTPGERAAWAVAEALQAAGHEAFVVGGAVRDRLLDYHADEADVTTDAPPERVQELFPRTIAVGAAFGVVVVRHEHQGVEVATYREDRAYVDGRRPEGVVFSDAQHDAERRDFTVNALYYDPVAHELRDYVDGLADLKAGILRAIGDPDRRLAEDYLRLLRAVRFATRLDFAVHPATWEAVCRHAAAIRGVSPERIFTELSRMLTGPRPHQACERLRQSGLLAVLLPEVAALAGCEQEPAFHPEGDAWTHTCLALSHLRHPDRALAWATLLHDVGKPLTTAPDEAGRLRSFGHAEEGAATAGALLRRLRAPNALVGQVHEAIARHMHFTHVAKMRNATIRRLLARDTFPLELELHRVDCVSCHRLLDNWLYLLDKVAEFAREPVLPPPLLNGRDILARGVAPGPAIGRLLARAQDLQLDGDLVDRPAALAWLDAEVEAAE